MGILGRVGFSLLLALLVACGGSSESACLLPVLTIANGGVVHQPGDNLTISASNFGPCSDQRGEPGTTSFPRLDEVHLGLARSPQPNGPEIPSSLIVKADLGAAKVDWENEKLRTEVTLPTDLEPGSYFVFLEEANIIRSSYVRVQS